MKTLFLGLVLACIASSAYSQTNADSSAIKNASLDYVEGWYEGNTARMERSLHPDLAKRSIRNHPRTGQPFVAHLSKSTMIEYTRAGGGNDVPKNDLFYDVRILNIFNNIATVTAVSARYVDYIHLAKWRDQWMIVNILWTHRT